MCGFEFVRCIEITLISIIDLFTTGCGGGGGGGFRSESEKIEKRATATGNETKFVLAASLTGSEG